ncbi:MAG: Z1 domain-containing protein [Metamycoplasmataceae bacterium]
MEDKILISNDKSPFDEGKKRIIDDITFKNFLQLNKNSDEINYFNNFLSNKRDKLRSLSLNNSLIDDDIFNLEKTINNVEAKIPEGQNINNSKLLIIGDVQSGKTDFMLGLTSKLFDRSKYKCNLIFVITTANKNLLIQTSDRFKTFFQKLSSKINFYLYDDLKNMKFQNFNQFEKNVNNNIKTIVFLQKQKENLELGINLLEQINLWDKKIGNIVIFDDEGDSYSFNNKWENGEQSTINSYLDILNEWSSKFGSSFISITATPFAHIMVDSTNNMKPEYAYILKPGNSYLGLKYFSEMANKKDSNVIKRISKEIDNFSDFSILTNNDAKIAIAHYFIQCCIFVTSDKYKGRKPRMMFNISREKESHFEIKSNIEQWLNIIVKTPDTLEESFIEIKDDYKNLIKINDFGENNHMMEFVINNIIPYIKIKVINSDEKANNDINLDSHNRENFEIIIGSDKLSRGLTFIDLTTAFVLRRSKIKSNADTVLQLARWFGYRADYKELLKIFLSYDLIDDYNITNYAVNDLFQLIKEFEKNNKSLLEFPQMFPTEKMKNDYGAVRKSVVETYWQNGFKLSYMNNKYEIMGSNAINKANQNFFKKFLIHFNNNKKTIDKYSYPIISFENFNEFNNFFFNCNINNRKLLYREYNNLFGIPVEQIDWLTKRNMIDKLFDNEEINKIVVRLINKISNDKMEIIDYKYKERKLNYSPNENAEFYSFGQGNYSGEEIPVENSQNNILYIDIIPIKVWHDDNWKIDINNNEIKRARIFIPKNMINKKLGLVAKT